MRPTIVSSEINVTPLIDVVLVLLIIFMVITPLAQRGYDIDVPPDGGRSADLSPVVLSISNEECPWARAIDGDEASGICIVRIGGESFALAGLAAGTKRAFEGRTGSGRILFLAAEESLNYERVAQILDTARRGAGEDVRIDLATDERLAFPPRPDRP